jgi:nucleoid DNA-binding protein
MKEIKMADRIQKDEVARRMAARMNSDPDTAAAWIDAFVETLYESFQVGESVTIRGFANFYVREERSSMVFKFNPSQRLRGILRW